ncbi:MAG: hypothetical protein ACREHG_02645 [Candidatus Saccharimonadales bacterium]
MDRLYETQVTCPAGTTSDTPFTAQFALEDATLISVEIVIPSGHAGLTGIRITRAGTPILPYSRGSFIVSNDEKLLVPFNGEMTATGLTVETFNSDIYDHTFYLRAVIQDLIVASGPNAVPAPTVANDALSSITGTGTTEPDATSEQTDQELATLLTQISG